MIKNIMFQLGWLIYCRVDGSVEYNVSKCIPPVRLYKESVDWIVAAGYIASNYTRNSAKSPLYRLAT